MFVCVRACILTPSNPYIELIRNVVELFKKFLIDKIMYNWLWYWTCFKLKIIRQTNDELLKKDKEKKKRRARMRNTEEEKKKRK